MPRSIASASPRATIIGRVTANRGLTEKPPGTQRSLAMIASYSSTHSRASSGSMNENDSAPMPFSAARRIVSRREQATHNGGGGLFPRSWGGGGRLLPRLGDDVARRHRQVAALPAVERLLDHHPRDDVERLVPLVALALAIDAEARELGPRRGLPRAELDAAARDEVEHRDRLGDPRRVLVARRQRQDAEAEPDVRGALAGGGEEHVGRTGVRVLLEEVVLDL